MSSILLALLLCSAGPDDLLAPGAKLEKLWGEGTFTEGGALAGDGGILFSDIGDRILRFDPATRAVSPFRDPRAGPTD